MDCGGRAQQPTDGTPLRAAVTFNKFVVDGAAGPAPVSKDMLEFHRTHVEGYAPTPLYALPGLAKKLGLRNILVKDESHRFGLGAFKALGASYAMKQWMAVNSHPEGITFCTATDGNHGRAVAWTARMLARPCVVFVPQNTSIARINAIRAEGARVEVVAGTYDETVRRAAAEAAANGWHVMSDTAYGENTTIPSLIMKGYVTLFAEIDDQVQSQGLPAPDAVLLQAGVGGLACAGSTHYRALGRAHRPALIVAEPLSADCLRASIASPDGSAVSDHGAQTSIMAGLNCGTPSSVAWEPIRQHYSAFVAIDDGYAEAAMRTLAFPEDGDPPIVSGESGAAGLAALTALCCEPSLRADREALRLGGSATVLLVSTEGATDPEHYRAVMEKEKKEL